MEKVIEVDFHSAWGASVFIKIGIGMWEDGQDAALSALLCRWCNNQRELAISKRSCIAAVRKGSLERARTSFVEAVAAAEVTA
jgi:hypothetical protein